VVVPIELSSSLHAANTASATAPIPITRRFTIVLMPSLRG
jgi:hypothetical protein